MGTILGSHSVHSLTVAVLFRLSDADGLKHLALPEVLFECLYSHMYVHYG